MKAEVVLTVAESKRLIAKGVAATGFVQERMHKGVIVVSRGGTNAYVYEELTGQTIDKYAYTTGRVTPAKSTVARRGGSVPGPVLVDGKPAPELDRFTALEVMGPGDIYIKGANALNYEAGVVGITIGHPTGGTIGGALGAIIAKKLRLLVPIGLEKEIPFDIHDASLFAGEPDEELGRVFSLWPVQEGLILTEIEALHTLCGVDAIPVGAGGILGAEGGVRLLLMGDSQAVKEAVTLVESIQGEPPLA